MSRALASLRAAAMCSLLATLLATSNFGQQKRSGKELFENRCAGCHSLDTDKVGPRLRQVFGRASGSVPSFKYSDALKASRIPWDEAALDKWLTDPDSVIADNDMSFRLENSQERAAIIEYLKDLAAK